jgi:peptidoglycan/xylan/chitin deacetylase (PgdA/CDA1 family)
MSFWWLLLVLLPPALWLAGRYTFWLPGRNRAWPRLIMLHRVTPLEPASGMNMLPDSFEALLRLLRKKGMRFVTVSELVENPGATRCVALTFDDGFADNYLYAFPLLKRYGAKATIYLAPDIAEIEKLDPAQIQEMYDSGLVEFGAHTVNHINLLRSDDALAREEIVSSRQRVIDIVGRCESFAYPFGRFAARHEAMVQEAGYSSAVSTRKDIAPFNEQSRYHIPRISSHGEMNALQWRIALAKGRWRL